LSFFLAFALRFDFQIPPKEIDLIVKTLPVLMICRLVWFYIYRLFSGWWQYAGINDMIDILKATFFSSVSCILGVVFLFNVRGFPRSVFIIDWILIFLLLSGVRLSARVYKETIRSRKNYGKVKDVLIVGAGDAGVMLYDEIRSNPHLCLHPIGFVDDNKRKRGAKIRGLTVMGTYKDIPSLVEKYHIDEVIVAIPSASRKVLNRIYEECQKAKVAYKTLPSLGRLLEGLPIAGQLQEVPVDNLLNREIIKFRREADFDHLRKEFHDKNILITGAGGSIGSELCRQVAQYDPRNLVLFERSENNLYYIELELLRHYPHVSVIPIIGDILDEKKLETTFQNYPPDIVYHAAAYKHVPMMEREPLAAVRNNIIGTYTLAKMSAKFHARKFVLISTDKAVRPANIMGATKRVAELILSGLNGNPTKFIAVRFGNVLNSDGSVIPLFKKQIEEGGPVTVTHPEVSRFFMAISEAVQLVMTAGAMGEGGEIFLLDMESPIKIVDLARNLIRSAGLEPDKDIEIKFIGLRPGEKLHEELYWEGEGIVPTENKKITMLRPDPIDSEKIIQEIQIFKRLLDDVDEEGVIRKLRELAPEYKPQIVGGRE